MLLLIEIIFTTNEKILRTLFFKIFCPKMESVVAIKLIEFDVNDALKLGYTEFYRWKLRVV